MRNKVSYPTFWLVALASASLPLLQGNSWTPQFSYTSPDLFSQTVSGMRAKCTWSKPVRLFDFIKEQVRGNYTYLKGKDPRWPGECGSVEGVLAADYLRSHAFVQVCHLVHVGDTSVEESILTRVGLGSSMEGIVIAEGQAHCLTLLAERPLGYANKPSFLVESGDTYLRPDGSAIPYPPIHPHHSNSYLVGFQEGMTPMSSPAFHQFTQLAIYSVDGFEALPDYPASMNTLGWNSDKLGCQKISDSAPCFFTKFPPGFGLPLHPDIDQWVDLMIDKNSQDDLDVSYIFELYRKYKTPKSRSTIQPLWMLDFSIVDMGYTYDHLPGLGPGVMWRTWKMPFAGTFKASWYHTHAKIGSEMVMFKGRGLPNRLADFCSMSNLSGPKWMYGRFCSVENFIKRRPDHRKCLTQPESKNCTITTLLRNSKGSGVFAPVPFHVLGISYRGLKNEVLESKGARCHFKSQRREVNGTRYNLGGAITRNSEKTCDEWSFQIGSTISMVVFVDKSDLENVHAQHHRFFSLAKLELPVEFMKKYG